MAADMPVSVGVAAERELLEPLRRWADMVLSTTSYSSNDLSQVIRENFAAPSSQAMTVTVSSFGFAKGMPPVADLVFDMRFLDNPHWVHDLRPLTGKDDPVAQHIRKDPAYEEAFARIRDLLLMLWEESETTLLVVEHHMGFVMSICEDIVVLDAGRLLARGAPAEVRSNQDVIQAYLGRRRRAGET